MPDPLGTFLGLVYYLWTQRPSADPTLRPESKLRPHPPRPGREGRPPAHLDNEYYTPNPDEDRD